jgi:hypothetical protein
LRSGAEIRELGAWLHRIARNVALNELASRAHTEGELSDQWEDCRRLDELEQRAQLRATLSAMAGLPERQRTALVRSASGESHSAIGAELGVSEVAARQLLHRARASLRAAAGAVLPPPVLWFGRRLGALAERLPSPPPSIEPLVPKLAVVVAAATAVAAPASLLHVSGHPSSRPAGGKVTSGLMSTASRTASGSDRSQTPAGALGPGVYASLSVTGPGAAGGSWPSSGSGAAPAGHAHRGRPSSGTASTTNGQGAAPTPTSGGSTADPNRIDQSAFGSSSTDPATTDAPAADRSITATPDPTGTDPSSAGQTSTDPTGTVPTSTDPSSPDPTSTDPTSTNPTSTDPSSGTP